MLLAVEVVAELSVDLLEYLPLAPELVDLATELCVVGHRVVVPLVRFVQAELQIPNILEQLLMLLMRLYPIHQLLLVQYLRLHLPNFLIKFILKNLNE